MLRSQLLSLVFFLLLSAQIAAARWFVLPGIFYTDEFGLVGTLVVVGEDSGGNRVQTQLQYFGEDEGQVGLELFLPRAAVEWTISANYQVNEQNSYSVFHASDQAEYYADVRYWTDLWIRCDFLKEGGFFYGLQGSYQRYDFGGGYADALMDDLPAAEAITFEEGEESTLSVRVGVEGRDNRYNSTRGTYLLWQTDLGQSRTRLMSEALVRSRMDLRRYMPLFWRHSTLAFNFRGGVVHSHVPYFSLFKMGGSYSLRGFPLDRYSGNAFYLFRTEFRQIVKEDLPSPLQILKGINRDFEHYTFSAGFVLFTEVGDLWREDRGWWGLRQNVGIGLRAVFPPNVVASVDLATPVDSNYLAIYLNLQQSF